MKNKTEFLSNFLGGNSLDKASPGPVKDFVAEHGGHTVITSVLIANNGIAAVKEIRSIRKWAYETFNNERAIQFTVMATPEDLKINADYIKMAEQYVEIPGGSSNNNYANVELIVDVAERGHASENPRLPEMLSQSKNKIVFIGPSASVMKSLGDKISSIIIAQFAKIPCMPWSGSNTNKVEIDSKAPEKQDQTFSDVYQPDILLLNESFLKEIEDFLSTQNETFQNHVLALLPKNFKLNTSFQHLSDRIHLDIEICSGLKILKKEIYDHFFLISTDSESLHLLTISLSSLFESMKRGKGGHFRVFNPETRHHIRHKANRI
ncbi:hypothetical protein PCK1_000302 [Pneumocystis canis]|nr:hypothetical protein PCK1_000302 [Pneumocystis canis]